jgi:hypothetical protein
MVNSEELIGRMRLRCDGTRRHMGEEMKGQQANGVGMQHASHYCGALPLQYSTNATS